VTGAVVLAAGGTGGHLFPAEALARLLVELGKSVHLMTDRRADAFAAAVPGVTVTQVRAGRLGRDPIRTAYALAEMALGLVQARRHLRQLAPDAVVGFGGYPSVPTMLAAAQLGYPTVIHEQNAVLGRANRLLSGRAKAIATAFPKVSGVRPADQRRVALVGNPVRPAILAGAGPYAAPAPGQPIELLVFGGSQGAHVFAEVIPPALSMLPPETRRRLRVTQQARAEDTAAVTGRLGNLGVTFEVKPFFDDMPARLARAHLVICRSGASTVAELSATGRPAILVPYPYAADDHQSVNARAVADAGAGWVIGQDVLSPPLLAYRLGELFGGGSPELANAAAAARAFARDDAADRLATLVLSLVPRGLERAA
jgi:UDP-N-acetylglucosamine--N-acetylmuramyl-(pentapeptide) pyrophosphoryl-undecaprenol N-acetylglucosamine transferase